MNGDIPVAEMIRVFVGVFDPGEVCSPGSGELRSHAAESGLEVLIGTFRLAVSLGVIAGG